MKIGIFTHYYKSVNYGGNLQAYALCRFLNERGYFAEQIPYDKNGDYILYKNSIKKSLPKRIIGRLKRDCLKLLKKGVCDNIDKRHKAILKFNQTIPHCDVIRKQNLPYIGEKYDCFITGSDQVWHPSAVCSAYLLDFEAKHKISYAASYSVSVISDEIKRYYSCRLMQFDAVSVREKSMRDLTKELCGKDVEYVLDPTLLLKKEEWDMVCSQRLINDDYVFCFFLGNLKINKKVIENYAMARNLKIVTMPYLTGISERGADFGDYKKYDVTPNDFISYVKYAKCVFTDSFHATVFSHIYGKEFFVFNRAGSTEMSDRIYSLTDLFKTTERFCDTEEKQNINYIENISEKPFKIELSDYEKMRQVSEDFILSNLKRIEAL